MPSRRLPSDFHVLSTVKTLSNGAFRFAFDQKLPMDDARVKIFRPFGTPGLASGAVSGVSREDKRALYADDDDGEEWDFSNRPADFHVDVCVSFRRDIDATRKL